MFFGARKGKRRRSFEMVNKDDKNACELGALKAENAQ